MNKLIVESLNIGLPNKEIFHGREIITSICKQPVSGPLRVVRFGFERQEKLRIY